MVLDENALEAMLNRANQGDDKPQQVQLTDSSDDFEVYERAPEGGDEEDAAPAPQESGPPSEEAPAQPAPEPPVEAPAQQEMEPPQGAPELRMPTVFPPVGAAKEAEHQPAPDTRTHAPESAAPTDAPAPPPTASPTASGGGCRLAILQCDFNSELTTPMAEMAANRAKEAGAQVTHTIHVPGVYDAPLAAQMLLRRDDVDAVVVVGVVVKGDTDHDQVITFATARSLQQVSLESHKPVGLGITGPGMSWAEAEKRIGNAAHAVDAAIAQWALLQTA